MVIQSFIYMINYKIFVFDYSILSFNLTKSVDLIAILNTSSLIWLIGA